MELCKSKKSGRRLVVVGVGRHVDDVLAAFVLDFGREQSEAERSELIKAVVQALTIFHGRAAGLVQAWQGAHRRM